MPFRSTLPLFQLSLRDTPFIILLNHCVFFGKWSGYANPEGELR